MTPLVPPPNPRRSPRSSKTEATRRVIVEAALAEFLDRGFAATRMSDVADRTGLAKGTVFLHFGDKASLFAGVLREVLRKARAGRPTPRPRPGEPTRAFLLRTVVPMLRELQASGLLRVIHLIVAEGPRFPELADVYRAFAVAPVLRLIWLYATRAERRGELRSDGLSHHPSLLVAPIVLAALGNYIFARNEPVDLAAVFEANISLLFVDPGLGRALIRQAEG